MLLTVVLLYPLPMRSKLKMKKEDLTNQYIRVKNYSVKLTFFYVIYATNLFKILKIHYKYFINNFRSINT